MAKKKAKELPRSVGRPTTYKPEFLEEFLKLSLGGKSYKHICKEWQISRQRLKDWGEAHPEFRDAVSMGREWCEAIWLEKGERGMNGAPINEKMFGRLFENMFRSLNNQDETQEKVTERPAKDLTDEELDED